jgi:hypothetical protein
MTGNWSNPKWDNALITVMKKDPGRITMCPTCGHFVIDKGNSTIKQYVRFHKSNGQCLNCAVCGMNFSGMRFIRYKDDLSNAITKFFTEIKENEYTVEDIRKYMYKSKRMWYIPQRNTSFTIRY